MRSKKISTIINEICHWLPNGSYQSQSKTLITNQMVLNPNYGFNPVIKPNLGICQIKAAKNWPNPMRGSINVLSHQRHCNMKARSTLVGGLEHLDYGFYDFPFSWECHHPN